MKGIYCLLVELKKKRKIKIGSLGYLLFEKGYYVYIGSALNGLEGRIARHLKRHKKMRWHIDYLLSCGNAKVEGVFVKQTSRREECTMAGKMVLVGKQVPKFGCGDCKCKSHLFKAPVNGALGAFRRAKLRNFSLAPESMQSAKS